MTLTNLTFTQSGSWYQSDEFTPDGDTAIEMAFTSPLRNTIVIETSLSGDVWDGVHSFEQYNSAAFVCNIAGCLKGQIFRIRCEKNPTSAKYMKND